MKWFYDLFKSRDAIERDIAIEADEAYRAKRNSARDDMMIVIEDNVGDIFEVIEWQSTDVSKLILSIKSAKNIEQSARDISSSMGIPYVQDRPVWLHRLGGWPELYEMWLNIGTGIRFMGFTVEVGAETILIMEDGTEWRNMPKIIKSR